MVTKECRERQMSFLSRFVVCSFFFSIHLWASDGGASEFETKCIYSSKARDQGSIVSQPTRPKRFVLFPEFSLWLGDWRYLHRPTELRYWISNYYPMKIDTDSVRHYIRQIIDQINPLIDYRIRSVDQSSSIDQANFHYLFFNYEFCPTEDPLATHEKIQVSEPLLIYPKQVIKEKHYRAHGGIRVSPGDDNLTISETKYNVHHTFLLHADPQYEPVIYTCDDEESRCDIDLFAVMLHESLHGFGIEVEYEESDRWIGAPHLCSSTPNHRCRTKQ